MPEIYADWKSLQPLTEPVPVGTKCVVIAKNKIDKLELGEIVTTFVNQSIAPWCRNSDMVHDALGINAPLVAAHEHFTGKAAGQFGEFGRGAGVQAQLIADVGGGLDHGW